MSQPEIQIEGLEVFFGAGHERTRVVHGIDLNVAQGESYGLVGESGSGKSTVLRALVGLVPDWLGTMSVGGEPLQRLGRSKAFYRTVQMVFQDPYASLHPRQTVDRVLSETLALHGIKDRVDARIDNLLEQVGLGGGFRFRYPHQLSGGQRQRVAIARALAPEPKVLLLDEPTSALDVSVQAEILNLLSDLRSEFGLTYLMVSHDLGVIGHMCDRVAVMQTGEIVETLEVEAMRRLQAEHPYTRHLLDSALRSAGHAGMAEAERSAI
ncbi:ABC transporter ATP-binding protein [Alloyangia pacifica]|uniref:ABC transporter ATP-binding protein n=1 Tax=Alloyangia pacifica TaxID=311180 RepID=UPI0031DBEAE0